MTHIMPKYRVAITPATEQDLYALQYAFADQMAHGEHQECKDNVVLASPLNEIEHPLLKKYAQQHQLQGVFL